MRLFFSLTMLAGTLFLCEAASGSQVENPFFKSWSSCKPGTTIVLRYQRQEDSARKTDIKYILISVSPDSIVVNVQVVAEGAGMTVTMPANNQTITRMVEEEDSARAATEIEKAPTESVTVPAGTFKTKVWNHVMASDPVASTKIWFSNDVPGAKVRVEMYSGSAGQQKLISTIELASIDKK